MAVTNSAICRVCNLPVAELQQAVQRSCPFCERSFRRVDAARRHARTCPARADRPLPEAKRGRKTRACHACSRDKTSCDGALPCARCSTRAADCVYSSVCHDASHREAGGGRTFVETAGRDERMTLSFLLEWSDPSRDPMLRMLETDSENQIQDQAHDTALPGLSAWLEGTIDPALLLLDLPTANAFDNPSNSTLQSQSTNADPTVSAAVKRMQTLEAVFRVMLASRPSLQTGFDQSYSSGFFTNSHTERALSTDSRRSSQLTTFIHWPTFDPKTASLPLLLAVVVVKTAYLDYSRETNVSILNTSFLELVEEYIFQKLKDDVGTSSAAERTSEDYGFDTCQAAGAIITVQCTINNPTARERVGTERIPYLSATLRKIGLMRSRHMIPLSEVDWESFAHTEAHVRLAMSLHNNCALLATFCNHPPAVAVREMTGSLPCDNDLWEAESQSAFQERQRQLPSQQPPLSFSEAINKFLNGEVAETMGSSLRDLSIHQLFVIIVGFQSVVYNFRASMLSGSSSSALLRALDLWASLWISAVQRTPDQELKGLGMMRIAPELAFLMKRVLEVSGTPAASGLGYFNGNVKYDTADLHEFVKCQGLSAAPMT